MNKLEKTMNKIEKEENLTNILDNIQKFVTELEKDQSQDKIYRQGIYGRLMNIQKNTQIIDDDYEDEEEYNNRYNYILELNKHIYEHEKIIKFIS